jgi:hypothetical protein
MLLGEKVCRVNEKVGHENVRARYSWHVRGREGRWSLHVGTRTYIDHRVDKSPVAYRETQNVD